MAHYKFDLVQETSTSTGTGALTLAGAVTRRRAFSAVLSNADTCYVLIESASAAEWEICLATYNSGGNTLSRGAVLSSSTGSAVSFSAGTKTISIVAPAAKSIVEDNNGAATVAGTLSAGTSVNAAAASGYLLGGVSAVSRDTNYTRLKDDATNNGITIGNATDPSNYYANTTHSFLNRAQSVFFATLNSTGLALTTALTVANGGTGDTGTQWTTFTPTITAAVGTFTTVSATGRYKSIGKTYFVEYSISITTNGTAAAYILATLPNGTTAKANCGGICGTEVSSNNKLISGRMDAGSAHLIIFNYDGSYPGATGYSISLSGSYEAA